ncbi:MAG: DUF1572 family protein [Chitinophagales bacterium]|nr:DUF1572 family protein [Chitinophagales bacterium]
MSQQFIAEQFEAALIQLKYEISSYTHRGNIWQIHRDIKNSAGTLCLHLLGNLNHFIGAGLGNTGYTRNRDLEFSERDMHTSKMMKDIDEATYRVKVIISGLSDEQMKTEYPLKDGRPGNTTEERLFHLIAHLNYHIGQIDYHRRLIEPPTSFPDGVEKLENRNLLP